MTDRRRMRRVVVGVLLASLPVIALMIGPNPATGAATQRLDLALCAPDQNSFNLAIDNSYFPLPVGRQWVLTGKEQGQTFGLQVTVLDATENFFKNPNRVTTQVVRETEWADTNGDGAIDEGEELIEVSHNYFAQTQDRTVCYFGEDVDIYEGGTVVSHEGSWRADTQGHAPGIFMPADPAVGMTFQQEVAPGIAEDEATIVATGTVKVPAGTYENAIKVRDLNPLDGSKGIKWYAPNVGLVVDGPLKLVSVTS